MLDWHGSVSSQTFSERTGLCPFAYLLESIRVAEYLPTVKCLNWPTKWILIETEMQGNWLFPGNSFLDTRMHCFS